MCLGPFHHTLLRPILWIKKTHGLTLVRVTHEGIKTVPIENYNLDKTGELRPVHDGSQKLSNPEILRVCPCPLNMCIEEWLSDYAEPFVDKT
jgi:hypothetical protein